MEKVAQSAAQGRQPRALLSLATGTGKTFIACHLLKGTADAGQLKRALFLCDRDELRTQGLTATPRQIECDEDTKKAQADAEVTADNLKYFGEPVYEYGLAQAMEDGYLAAREIQLAQVNLDATGITAADIIARNPRNANTGQPLSAAEIAAAYVKTDFESSLLLPDRVNAMCYDLFSQLLASDPERGPLQKTIIFCARDRHADDVTAAMNNLYA